MITSIYIQIADIDKCYSNSLIVVDTFILIIYFIELCTIILYMTQLGSSVTYTCSSRNKRRRKILSMQECKGPKCIGMTLNIQELYFSVNSSKKVLQRGVVHIQFVHETFQLICKECKFKKSIYGYTKKIYIFFGYLKTSGPNVNCVKTCLLQKHPWQSTFIYTWHGKSIKYKEPPKVFGISKEIPIPPK